jgi:hypothetical protein
VLADKIHPSGRPEDSYLLCEREALGETFHHPDYPPGDIFMVNLIQLRADFGIAIPEAFEQYIAVNHGLFLPLVGIGHFEEMVFVLSWAFARYGKLPARNRSLAARNGN